MQTPAGPFAHLLLMLQHPHNLSFGPHEGEPHGLRATTNLWAIAPQEHAFLEALIHLHPRSQSIRQCLF